MAKQALIVVDYSYDFVAPDGKLTCGEPGQAIDHFIAERMKAYDQKGEDIFIMMDLHYENDDNHPESKLFPPHNIEGTSGRDLYGEVKEVYDDIKDHKNVHYLDKRRYDSFFGTPLDSLLRERDIKTIEIVGVCTDICVFHTAVSGYNKGYDILIPTKGVASFNQAGHDFALEHFKNVLGAKVE